MTHLTEAESIAFDLHGVTFHSFAASRTGAQTLAAWRADFAPNTPGTAHSMTDEEVLHVLSGSLEIELGDRQFTASTGEAVLVPADTRFRVSNLGDRPAQAWVTTTLGMRAELTADGTRIAPPWAQ